MIWAWNYFYLQDVFNKKETGKIEDYISLKLPHMKLDIISSLYTHK